MGHVSDAMVWWAVTVDCADPEALAAFWSAVFGVPVIEPGSDRARWRRVQPLANGPAINFQPVPEPKRGKVRLHLDVLVPDIDAAVERIVALGGTDTGTRETLPRGRIAVMRDPEGNEFCLLAAPS
jgi:predicted enzyme related to lactoylglutathione lyase